MMNKVKEGGSMAREGFIGVWMFEALGLRCWVEALLKNTQKYVNTQHYVGKTGQCRELIIDLFNFFSILSSFSSSSS